MMTERRFLDPDMPLPPPTVRSLIPSYVWGWDIIDLTQEEFERLPLGRYASRPADFNEVPGAMYRSTTNRYGERVGAWQVKRVKGKCGSNTHYEFLLIHIDGKPLIEDFVNDPYYNLELR